MKQVFIKGKQIVVDEVPPPAVADNGILVANVYSVISTGTEVATVKGQSASLAKRALQRPELIDKVASSIRQQGVIRTLREVREAVGQPSPLGYSSAGIVFAVGRNVVDINQQDRVACGGLAHHAEIVSIPRNLVARIPASVSFEEASFATIGSIAMHSVRRASLQFGETMVCIGLGLVGLLAVQIARAGGYKVIGFDTNESRVALAKSLGIDNAFTVGKCSPVKDTLALTDGFGADAVGIYAAGKSGDVVNLAFDLCRPKGKVVIVGSFPMDLDRSKMYRKELELLMSTSYGPGRYDPVYEDQSTDYPIGYVRWTENRNMEEFLSLLAEGKIQTMPLISAIHSVDEAAEAYRKLASPEAKPAVLLKYHLEGMLGNEKVTGRIFMPGKPPTISAEKARIAIVGAGDFVRNYRLPVIRKLSDCFQLRAIVTAHSETSKSLAENYEADYSTTDYHEVLADTDVDMVMIGTRHDLHYPIIMDALKAGKRVFVEKPLCLRREELNDITQAVKESGIPVIVGFNRRYSPLAETLKEALAGLPKPYLIHYRVNTGIIPANHWTLDPQVGGGRIIGEACHFFDLFNFLVGKDTEVSNIQVRAIPVDGKQVVSRDNIETTISYNDGSLASLTYTTLGSPKMEKERTEVFAGNSSFVLNDYLWLESYSYSLDNLIVESGKRKKNRLVLHRQVKGVEKEMSELARFFKGEESQIISFSEVVKATEITLRVEELSRSQQNQDNLHRNE
jgi:predicted dehydrogenase/threonine dehydrogenase-like Zn-dependent dehydrogenase